MIQKDEHVKQILDDLEQGIRNVFDSENYKHYLNVMARFHTYSYNNSMLIAMQYPEASMVAGYHAWRNNFHRTVRHGEHGIEILAPCPYVVEKEVDKVDPDTHQPVLGRNGKPIRERVQVTIPAFKVVKVFDISQTEGEDLPTLVTPLKDDVADYQEFKKAIERISPVPVEFADIKGSANGYYAPKAGKIVIQSDMGELQTIKTMIHELSHSLLHDKEDMERDRRSEEVEAESIAYTVCRHYGLDTSDYSFGYLANWSSGRDIRELKKSIHTIQTTASDIIKQLDAERILMQEEARPYTVMYYAAECAEIHSMGAYYECPCIQDAIQRYEEIRKTSVFDQAEIGFIYYDKIEPLYDGYELYLYSDGRINEETINDIEPFRKCEEIQQAIDVLKRRYRSHIRNTEQTQYASKTKFRSGSYTQTDDRADHRSVHNNHTPCSSRSGGQKPYQKSYSHRSRSGVR